MDESRRVWVAHQVRVLLTAGVTPAEVETIMRQTKAMLPDEDVNLMEWLPATMPALEVSPLTVHDARVAWYATAPAKFKRILDAAR